MLGLLTPPVGILLYICANFAEVKLEAPLQPAGFEGSDQTTAPPEIGYIPPQLIDEEFYRGFKGEYRGTEEALTPVSGAGAFSAAAAAASGSAATAAVTATAAGGAASWGLNGD